MATTLQQSINWALGYLGYSTPTVGPNNEPALSSANMVQQIMTSPPFRFPWNRNTLTFTTVIGTQDYTEAVADFGYMETATFRNLTTGKIMSFGKVLNSTPIGESSDSQQPITIAVQSMIVGTNVTFRLLGVPNAAYPVIVTYQKFAPLMTLLTSTWTPPDYMQYIYNKGFLAHCLEANNSSRAAQEKVAFAAALLATSEGLTDTEKNLFLSQYLANPRDIQTLQLKTQQGVIARGQ